MSETPSTMKLGMAIAFIGAIIALYTMIQAWTGEVESAPYVGIDMAAAMMFFASAGCFSSYSPVKGSTVIVISAIAIALSIIGAVYGSMEPIFAVILVILGAVCVFCGNLPSTQEYIEEARII